jgi:hypothetical protein
VERAFYLEVEMTPLSALILSVGMVAVASVLAWAWIKIEQIRAIAKLQEANARLAEAQAHSLEHLRAIHGETRQQPAKPAAQIIPLRKPEPESND